MKKLLITYLLIIVNGFGLMLLPLAAQSATQTPLNKIVVIVNDDIITQNEINQAMAAAKQQLLAHNTPIPAHNVLRKQVINNLIYTNIQRQMAKNAGVKVNNDELNKAIINIAKHNHMTLSQLKQSVRQNGISYPEYRKQIREQIQFSRLQRQAFGNRIEVSNQEISAFMRNYQGILKLNQEYHLENILIPLPDSPSPQQIQTTKKRAQKIFQQIKSGVSFRKLAATHSGGDNALQGGDLGWHKLAELPTIFVDPVKTMQPGQVIGPIRAPNGFHIIKLLNIRDSKQKLSKNQIRNLIYQRKFEEKLQNWLKTLRDEAYVKFV